MFFDGGGEWGHLMVGAVFNGGNDSQWQGDRGKEEYADTSITYKR
jgi:hypothetical protein